VFKLTQLFLLKDHPVDLDCIDLFICVGREEQSYKQGDQKVCAHDDYSKKNEKLSVFQQFPHNC
jgi:hypothetical protein